ncbi:GNAT family N-acetyltransferase [Pseudochryseolinea flava]|uniref:N-acetyltransferase domain-containing protein n=1 Tax=Pseudochryseolinea flava TaxID=2059302 RepID=A0A364Y5E9_9BACT|nr:GNAT family N-acetyltransferase [Pseudochryseolinea flava]RAW01291.1 hypothetical protein DQQ10_10295 [Pseudochryseolinea flava]
MNIRKAVVQDVPAIVALLKQSLGESLMPKSEAYWKWKHVDNPFGISPVLVAEENGILIGIRAFMRWQWHDNKQIFSTLRAVDTATHPGHQGKGIFKKLTLQLVKQCTDEGDHFVFNTPNTQSRPGYLKMGWVVAGKVPVRMSVNRPLSMLAKGLAKTTTTTVSPSSDNLTLLLKHAGLSDLLDVETNKGYGIQTHYSSTYLDWRYRTVPVASYLAFGETHGNSLHGLVIGRIKQTRIGNELRITDCFIDNEKSLKHLQHQLKQAVQDYQIDYTTIAGTSSSSVWRLLPGTGSFLKLPIGPVATVRALALEDLSQFHNFANWSPSFGDLELF